MIYIPVPLFFFVFFLGLSLEEEFTGEGKVIGFFFLGLSSEKESTGEDKFIEIFFLGLAS